MEDIIIIGAGPIGLYAATLASLHELKGKIFDSQESIGGQLTALYPEKDIVDLPGFTRLTAAEFSENLYHQYISHENRLDLHLNEGVKSITPLKDGVRVQTLKGTYLTKTLLISTGMGEFNPRKMNLPDEDKYQNIIYSIKDKNVFKNKKIAILGGGDSAVDWALMLEPIAKEVSIVHRRSEFRAQSSSVEQMKTSNVKVFTPYVPYSLKGEEDILHSISIKESEGEAIKEIPVDYLFVNYGMIPAPNTFPVEKVGANIKVYDAYQTSVPNVFAIGNIITYPGKVKNITSGLGEAVIAITKIDQIINPNKNIPVHF